MNYLYTLTGLKTVNSMYYLMIKRLSCDLSSQAEIEAADSTEIFLFFSPVCDYFQPS